MVSDKEIGKIKQKIGDFGSGYPSDKFTIDFLKSNFTKLKNSEYVRKSWQTWKKLESKTKQAKLSYF